MSKIESVHAKMIEALKAGEKERKGTLSLLLQALEKKQKDKLGQLLTEAEENEVILKVAKQIQESIDACPAEREDVLAKLRAELSVVSEFMPAQMSEAEIRATIDEVLSGLGIIGSASVKDKGRIMKELMPRVKGKADGKLVNQLLTEYLI